MSMSKKNRYLGILRNTAIALLIGAATASAQEIPTESRIIQLASGQPAYDLSLSLNKATIIELDRDARDVLIANPEIIDAVVRTPRRIFILALGIGQTNAIFLDQNGNQIATLEITVGTDVTALNSIIRRNIPGSQVTAESLNDNVVLSGTVMTASDASKVQELAMRFTGSLDKVVNMLTIAERNQVLIKVRVSEVSRTIAKQFGLNLSAVTGAAGVPIIASTSNQFSLLGRALSDLSGAQFGQVCRTSALNPAGTTFGFSANSLCVPTPNNVQGIIQALERVGLVRTLAEPNLTAVSGEVARFLAGGEFPVPSGRDQNGNVTVEFKQFGIALAFTPIVLSKNRISLQISIEVSELTNTGALTLADSAFIDSSGATVIRQGLTLPALAVRRTETTVELPSGGSLAIGGLIREQTKQNLDAFPGLKDLPVLGALFRSRDFQSNETELVVTVTAYLIDPVAESQIVTPNDGLRIPTDLETIFLGRLNSVYGTRSEVPVSENGASIGYIVQ